jgi:SAM-dependent methyltransferase
LFPRLAGDKNAAILDIACGTGQLLFALQNNGYSNSKGIDIGAEQLEIARNMGVANIEQENLFDHLKTRKNRYDIIIASHILEHLTKEEVLECVGLIYKALKPGGRILALIPNVTALSGAWLAFSDFTHEIVFTPRSFCQILRVCGFSDLKIYGLGPVFYGLRSGIRVVLWNILKTGLRLSFIIEQGAGCSVSNFDPVFEPVILGAGRK